MKKKQTLPQKKEKSKKSEKKVEENTIKFGDIRIVQVLKNEPRIIRVKKSYQEAHYLNIVDETKLKRGQKKPPTSVDFSEIVKPPAYREKPSVSERKKTDISYLIFRNYIPQYYEQY